MECLKLQSKGKDENGEMQGNAHLEKDLKVDLNQDHIQKWRMILYNL